MNQETAKAQALYVYDLTPIANFNHIRAFLEAMTRLHLAGAAKSKYEWFSPVEIPELEVYLRGNDNGKT